MWQHDNYVLQVLQFDYPLCSGESIVNLHRQNEAIAVVAPLAHTINPHVHTIGEFNKGDVENKIISLQKKR